MQQLMMWWKKQPVNDMTLPNGYMFRTYRDGDAKGWIEVCSEGLGTGEWSEADFEKNMLQKEGLHPEGLFLIVNEEDEIVGTVSGVILPNGLGYVHMVSISPKCRGLGMARPLNAVVLDYLVRNNCEDVMLTTDDFRISAIKSYLSAGFKPVLHDTDMADRWQKVLEVFGYEEINTFTEDGKPGPILKIIHD